MSTTANPITLSIREPLGLSRPNYPVTMGVPFPQGILKSTENLRLEANGQAVPLQAKTTANWPDGSIKWVLLDFQLDLQPGADNRCELYYGQQIAPGPQPSHPVSVSESSGEVTIDTGPVQVTLAEGAPLPFTRLSLNGRVVATADSIDSSMQVDGKHYELIASEVCVVELSGPLRAVVRCEGTAVAEDGSESFHVTTRIYAYAGKSHLRVYLTLTNTIPEDLVHLEDFTFAIRPKLSGAATGFVVSSAARGHGKAYVDHLIEGRRELRVDVVEMPGAVSDYDERVMQASDEYVVIPGDGDQPQSSRPGADWHTLVPGAGVLGDDDVTLTMACRHPWHNAPKQTTVTDESIELALYPKWAGPLQWYRGVAKTHELLIDLQAGAPDEDERLAFACAFEKRPAPQVATRNWMTESGAFGPLLRYKPEEYPWWEFVLRDALKKHIFNAEREQFMGRTMLDFGDYWRNRRGGQWLNNEMDKGFGLLLQMVRTGYPVVMDAVEPIIHHMIDVDTIHDAADPIWIGGQTYHFARHGAGMSPALCHEWLEGPLFFYLLTGYERAREVALMRAEHLCYAIEAGWHRTKSLSRVSGYPLMALTCMYSYFGAKKYIQACEKIIDWLEEWWEEEGGLLCGLYGPPGQDKTQSALADGVAACALARYHSATGSERAWELLNKLAKADVEEGRMLTPEGHFIKQSSLVRDYYAPEPDFWFEALAYLSQQTGNLKYAEIAYRNMQRLFVTRKMFDSERDAEPHFYRYWLTFLDLAERLGILTDPKPF